MVPLFAFKEPNMLATALYSYEITLLFCESCFDIIIEDDAEYHHDKCYCHHCIEEVRQ